MKGDILKLVKALSRLSSNKARSREYKELGYGKFEFLEITEGVIFKKGSEHYYVIEFKLNFVQPGYKSYGIISKVYHVLDGVDNINDFYNQFYEEMIACCACSITSDLPSLSFKDLINKGLPDNYKNE